MSQFLGFESFLIPLGSSIADVKTTIDSSLIAKGWRKVREGIAPTTVTSAGFASPGNVLDMNPSTSSQTATSVGAYIAIQMPSSFNPVLVGFGAAVVDQNTDRGWRLEYSDVSLTGPWTTVTTYNEPITRPSQTKTYPVSTTGHIYWRIVPCGSLYATATTLFDWIFEDASGNRVSSGVFSDFIPPVGEEIGDANGKELFRIEYNASSIYFKNLMQSNVDIGQAISIAQYSAGAVTPTLWLQDGTEFDITASLSSTTLTVTACSGTITVGSIINFGFGINTGIASTGVISGILTGSGGIGTYSVASIFIAGNTTVGSMTWTVRPAVSVSGATGSTGSSAADNLRSLYEALRNSSNPVFTDWEWEYQRPPAQGGVDTNTFILGVKKTQGNFIYPYASGATAAIIGFPVRAGTYSNRRIYGGAGLTTDLVSGFIYYLQVNKRSVHLATKTNAGYYGPIHASYATNSKAIEALPVSSGWSIPCTPVELFVGSDNGVTQQSSIGQPTHGWGIGDYWDYPWGDFTSSGKASGSLTNLGSRHKFVDMYFSGNPFTLSTVYVDLLGSNLFTGVDGVGNDFQVHKVSAPSITTYYGSYLYVGGGYNIRYTIPQAEIHDWYKFTGTATDETLLLIADTVMFTTLSNNHNSSVTTVNVASTTGFNANGFIVIEGELIQYTGVTPTSFTGCTRARYATVATTHFSSDRVSQGLWFTKINGGALFCGYTKPT